MCLQTTWKKPRKVLKDKIVYKLLEKIDDKAYKSPYNHFEYTLKKRYTTKMQETTDDSSFDDIALDARDDYYTENEGKGLISIAQGFHSAKSIKRLTKEGLFGKLICKCKIPKGAEYYYGLSDLYVSNKIIVLEEVKL